MTTYGELYQQSYVYTKKCLVNISFSKIIKEVSQHILKTENFKSTLLWVLS